MRPFIGVNRLLAAALVLALLPAAAHAQMQPGSFGDYKMDAKKPVDIQADWLEVDDKKQVATLRGNVIAKQGDYTIRAKELIINYIGPQQKKAAAQTVATGGKDASADIKYIEAKGNVSVTSARDTQSAKANNAHFDVKAQTITMFDDVVVSKDKNVIKGERLLIELALGKSTFLSADPNAAAASADPHAPKERLRMIIDTDGKVSTVPVPGNAAKKHDAPQTNTWAPPAPR